ncbi:MAG: hypothetical protein OK456_11085 [Thaumarchaeota archaeon]|nr:hypothetical protein [Nitrososphaerota archaeon]
MDSPESRSRARLAASVVLLVVIGASLIGAAYLRIGQSGTSTTSTSSASSTLSRFGTGLKLNLQVSTNATGALSISVNETNLLDRANNVTTADNWPYPNTSSLPCGNFEQFPIEYAMLQGNYNAGNYTSASALAMYDPGLFLPCPTAIALPAYLLFAPLGDNASYPSGQGSFLVSASCSVTGYWTGSGNTAAFQQFPPGIYTVLAEDEWGNVVLLPFTVQGS